MKSKTKNILFILVGFAILAAMVFKIGAFNIYQEFSKVDPYLLFASFLLVLLSLFIKMYRWGKLYTIAERMDAWSIYIVGVAVNLTMPTGSGELTRAYIAKSKLNVPIGDTLAPVVIERMADTTFLLALSFAYLAFLTVGNGLIFKFVVPSIILFTGYYLLLKPIYISKFALILEGFSGNSLFGTTFGRVSRSLMTFKEAITRFSKGEKVIWQTILLTIITWFVYGMGIYVLLLAFGNYVSIFIVVAITAVSEIIGTFSFLPGGLGAKDISFAALLIPFGVSLEVGISAYLMARLMGYVQIGTGAWISLVSLNKKYPVGEIF